MLFQWLARLSYTIFYFTALPEYSDNPINDDMYIFPQVPARSATTMTWLLDVLKYNFPFLLRGLGTIHVERVEYRKSRSAEEHEYLVVTVKKSSGAWWRGSKRWDPPRGLDRLFILCDPNEARKVQGRCAYDVLMTMDLPRSITLEERTAAQSHFPELPVCIHHLEGSRDGDRGARGPDQLCCTPGLSFWEELGCRGRRDAGESKVAVEAKVLVGREFDASLKVLRAPVTDLVEALRQEQAALLQDKANMERERAGRLRAEAEINELRARLARLEQSATRNVSINV